MLHGYIQLYIIQFEIKNNYNNKKLISDLDDNIQETLSSLEYINYFDINKRSNTRIIKFTTIQPAFLEDTYINGSKDQTLYYIFKKNELDYFKLDENINKKRFGFYRRKYNL